MYNCLKFSMRKAAAFGYILTQKNLTVCQECGKGTFSQSGHICSALIHTATTSKY